MPKVFEFLVGENKAEKSTLPKLKKGGMHMKKTVVVTLEVENENEFSLESILDDLRTEVNCASLFYTIKNIEEVKNATDT